jgi:hypothetical protein
LPQRRARRSIDQLSCAAALLDPVRDIDDGEGRIGAGPTVALRTGRHLRRRSERVWGGQARMVEFDQFYPELLSPRRQSAL